MNNTDCTNKSEHEPGTYEVSAFLFWATFGFFVINVLLTVVSVIFGITSWILIKQWRQYKNYVFLNGIAMCGPVSIFMYLYIQQTPLKPNETFYKLPLSTILNKIGYVVSCLAMCHWLSVATVMVHMDIVNVFSDGRRRYLMTNLFGWAAPILEAIAIFTGIYVCQWTLRHLTIISLSIAASFIAINTVIYVKVLFTLITECDRSVWQNLYLLTGICITSGISSYAPLTAMYLCGKDSFVQHMRHIGILVTLVNIFMLIVFFLSNRCHREQWRVYLERRKNLKLVMV